MLKVSGDYKLIYDILDEKRLKQYMEVTFKLVSCQRY